MNNFDFPYENWVFRDDKNVILLYKMKCLDFMNNLIINYPEGIFDMIFADPTYFLSNAGINDKVDKGE